MTNQYFRLWNGKDILEDDSVSQTKQVTYDQMKSDIFDERNISIKSVSQIGKNSYLRIIDYLNEQYNVLFLNIKNSGLKNEPYRKRMQISNDIDFHNNKPIYVIGAYNVGDKTLYCSANITNFVKGALKGKTYSSFWIDYYHLQKAYEKGKDVWIDNKNRTISCYTVEKLKIMDDTTLLRNILIDDDISIEQLEDNVNYTSDEAIPVLFDEKSHSYNHKLLPRNQQLRNEAIKKANYTCELCGIQKTFDTKESNQYFEGHHLIMYNYNVQKRYKYCLDNLENIVCLCPTCHKKIHLSTDQEKKDCVIKLLIKHKKLIDLFEINDLEPIINDYIIGVKDDE